MLLGRVSRDSEQGLSQEVVWHPLATNISKLNVDGSLLGNPGKYGFGGKIRDSYGQWLN